MRRATYGDVGPPCGNQGKCRPLRPTHESKLRLGDISAVTPSWVRGYFIPLVLFGLLSACGDRVGTPCEIVGSGFSARDSCATKCLSYWHVTCPDGRDQLPGICAGQRSCSPGSCPSEQACYSFNDPFDEVSYCVPEKLCGTDLSAREIRAWEEESAVKAGETRAYFEKKKQFRGKRITKPAEP